MKKILVLAALLSLAGCDRPVGSSAMASPPKAGTRFTGTIQGYVTYQSEEFPIVLLKDEETGQEYVLVRGFGSSMLVRQGKTSVEK